MAAISQDLEEFVQQEVTSGRFVDRDAVIAHALQLLRRDREETVAGIEAGLADVAAGRIQPLDVAFDELRRELRAGESR
jgi:Arc/MetJ-type ribon-helix-helix transcriptional regulator